MFRGRRARRTDTPRRIIPARSTPRIGRCQNAKTQSFFRYCGWVGGWLAGDPIMIRRTDMSSRVALAPSQIGPRFYEVERFLHWEEVCSGADSVSYTISCFMCFFTLVTCCLILSHLVLSCDVLLNHVLSCLSCLSCVCLCEFDFAR